MIRIFIKRTEIIVQIEGLSVFSYNQSYYYEIDEKYNRFFIIERDDQINNERNIAFSAPLSSTIIFNHDKRRN